MSDLDCGIFLEYQLRLVPLWAAEYSIEHEKYICTCKRKTYCHSPGKHAIFKNWDSGPVTNPKHKSQILNSRCGFAVATGPLPKDPTHQLVVYDIDTPALEAKDPFLDQLPPTLTVRTRSAGLHYYYLIPAEFKINNLSTGYVDIRATGGYVLAPPTTGYDFTPDSLNHITILSEPLQAPVKTRNPRDGSTCHPNPEKLIHGSSVPVGQRDYFVFSTLRNYVEGGMPLPDLLRLADSLYDRLEQPANDQYSLADIRSKAYYVYETFNDPKAEEMYIFLENDPS